MNLPRMKTKSKLTKYEITNHRDGSKEFFFTASYYVAIINIRPIMPEFQFTFNKIIES